jgi:hypothetical protein
MAQHRNRPTIYHQGTLRIIVPGHAQKRMHERGDTQPLLRAIAALRAQGDIPVRQPVALKGDQVTVVFEFRARKTWAVVATVLSHDAGRIGRDTLIIPVQLRAGVAHHRRER